MDAFWLGLRLLLLLTIANSIPILLTRMLGDRWSAPIDFGRRFLDGRPWLGPSKTWRGLASAVLACALAAPLLGLHAVAGAVIGLLAMIGDALSSFIKRRLGVMPGDQSFGLDQIPESLLPLLLLHDSLGIPWSVIAAVTLAFVLLETPVARLAHRAGLRERPY